MKQKPQYSLILFILVGLLLCYGAATAKRVGKFGIGRPFYGPWERYVYFAGAVALTLYGIYLFVDSFRYSRRREIRAVHKMPLSWPACVLSTISGEDGALITVETDFDIGDNDEIDMNVIIELVNDQSRDMDDLIITSSYICNSVTEEISKKGRWSGVIKIYNRSRLREVGDREIGITIRAAGREVSLPRDMRMLEMS